MASKAAVVTGLIPTSGTRDFTVTGFGTVDAAIVIVSQASSAANPVGGHSISIGFWDGVNSQQHVYANWSANNQGTSVTNRIQRTDKIINTNNNFVEGTVSAITNGLQVSMTGSTGSERYVTFIFIGGATDVHLAQQSLGTGTSAIDITAPGFKPNLVFFLSNGNASSQNNSNDTLAIQSFGVAHNNSSDTVTQGAILARSDNAVDISDTYMYATHSAVAGQINSSSADWTASVSDFDASGFSITPSANAGDDAVSYLAIQLADADDAWVDIIDAATSTGNSSVTGTGFSPEAIGLVAGLATSLDSVVAGRSFTFGAADTDSQRSIICCDEDAVDTTDASSRADLSNVLNLRDQNDGVDAVASLGSLDSDGFTLNYSDSASAAFKILAFAIGDSTAGAGFSPYWAAGSNVIMNNGSP